MKIMSHHPSCKPSDKTLGYLCEQCGTFEPVDEGVVVPREPTEAMYNAADIVLAAVGGKAKNVNVDYLWGAMLAAAQKEGK